MEKKIIFFDIDGTLIEEGKNDITQSSIEAIHQAQKNGHLCFINTGRPKSIVGENITRHGFDGYICGCGTYLEYQGKEIFHTSIAPEVIREVIAQSQKAGVDLFFEGKDGMTFPPRARTKDVNELKKGFQKQNATVWEYQYESNECYQADKFMIWFTPGEDMTELKQFLQKDFDIIIRGEDFWEVVPKGYSKASGIDLLLKYLGRDLNDTISIGDSTNDIPMLKHTKESVLMGNGTHWLKNMVTYVTKDITENGIYHALEHFRLI